MAAIEHSDALEDRVRELEDAVKALMRELASRRPLNTTVDRRLEEALTAGRKALQT